LDATVTPELNATKGSWSINVDSDTVAWVNQALNPITKIYGRIW
jgi:hypothetical protein